jgi:hypothetical protein
MVIMSVVAVSQPAGVTLQVMRTEFGGPVKHPQRAVAEPVGIQDLHENKATTIRKAASISYWN